MDTKQASGKSLSMVPLQGPFIILAVGAVGGVCTLLVEVLYRRKTRRKVHPTKVIQVQQTEVTTIGPTMKKHGFTTTSSHK